MERPTAAALGRTMYNANRKEGATLFFVAKPDKVDPMRDKRGTAVIHPNNEIRISWNGESGDRSLDDYTDDEAAPIRITDPSPSGAVTRDEPEHAVERARIITECAEECAEAAGSGGLHLFALHAIPTKKIARRSDGVPDIRPMALKHIKDAAEESALMAENAPALLDHLLSKFAGTDNPAVEAAIAAAQTRAGAAARKARANADRYAALLETAPSEAAEMFTRDAYKQAERETTMHELKHLATKPVVRRVFFGNGSIPI